MLSLLQKDGSILDQMCTAIEAADSVGIYSGAYRAVRLAVRGR